MLYSAGFLYTGDGPEDIKGNMGLLDQAEAMRWVNKYIQRFGGDKENVTIFGESAGSIQISGSLPFSCFFDLKISLCLM